MAEDKQKMSDIMLKISLSIFFIGLLVLSGFTGNAIGKSKNSGKPDLSVPTRGIYDIVVLIEVKPEHSLMFIQKEGDNNSPHYQRIEKSWVINWEDVYEATQLEKIWTLDLQYIKFITDTKKEGEGE